MFAGVGADVLPLEQRHRRHADERPAPGSRCRPAARRRARRSGGSPTSRTPSSQRLLARRQRARGRQRLPGDRPASRDVGPDRVGRDVDRRRRAAARATRRTPSRPHTRSALVQRLGVGGRGRGDDGDGVVLERDARCAGRRCARRAPRACRRSRRSPTPTRRRHAGRATPTVVSGSGPRTASRQYDVAGGRAEGVEAALAEAHQRARHAGGAQARRADVDRAALGDAVEVEARAGRQA